MQGYKTINPKDFSNKDMVITQGGIADKKTPPKPTNTANFCFKSKYAKQRENEQLRKPQVRNNSTKNSLSDSITKHQKPLLPPAPKKQSQPDQEMKADSDEDEVEEEDFGISLEIEGKIELSQEQEDKKPEEV
jgi:hypothetical protein